jgi:LmbE family N-acetylglucosaminyl deacetylase
VVHRHAPTAPTWSDTLIRSKAQEVERVAAAYGFARVHRLGHPATKLADVDRSILIAQPRAVADDSRADTVYCVSGDDIHQDHQALFAAAISALKPFRSAVKSILAYETISSSDIATGSASVFRPSVFTDISSFIEEKLRILSLYESETASAPFPRSPVTVRALAQVRGAAAGCLFAEAFQSIRESK